MVKELPRLLPISMVGSYPRPFYLGIPSWFGTQTQSSYDTSMYDRYMKKTNAAERERRLGVALQEVIKDQELMGSDILTDGEMKRENYIHYHCRHLNGFDFEQLRAKKSREGNYEFPAPNVVGKVTCKESFLTEDWIVAQALTKHPVKVTLPGPLTIADTVANTFYPNLESLCEDLSVALNTEIIRLCENGVKYIQIDEPLFARKVKEAYEYGFRTLEQSLAGVEKYDVHITVHMCCGYSDIINEEGFRKAKHHSYVLLADGIEKIENIDCVSLEDARERIPDELFKKLKRLQVMLGVQESCNSKIRSSKAIEARIMEIIELGFPAERLVLSPDCGMAMQTRSDCAGKMEQLKIARDSLVKKLSSRSKKRKLDQKDA